MATSKDFKEYVLQQLSDNGFDDIKCRAMMGEYLLYNSGVLFGGIYDNRVLIKIVPETQKYEMGAEIPYDGAKPMYLLDMESEEVADVINTTCDALKAKK